MSRDIRASVLRDAWHSATIVAEGREPSGEVRVDRIFSEKPGHRFGFPQAALPLGKSHAKDQRACALPLLLLLLTMLCVLFVVAPVPAQAQGWWEQEQETTLEDPVGTGQRSLARLPGNQWYDAEEDDITAGHIPTEPTPDARPGSQAPVKQRRSSNRWGSGSGGGSVLSWLIVVGVIVILGSLLGLVVWGVLRSRANLANPDQTPRTLDEISSQVDKVEHLPFKVKRPDANLLDEAQRHYQQGDYSEAIIYLFSYQLLELDKGQIIRLAKGKTNGQYLMDMRHQRPLQGILRTTVDAFEDVFFGHRKLTRGQFEACWEHLSRFQSLIQGSRPA